MLKQIKYWLSFIWPVPIYIGKGLTTHDAERERIVKFKALFNRRVNRNTIKYHMEPEFALFELVQVTKDVKSQCVLYQLQHCATGHLMTVDDTTFNLLFKRED